MNQDNSQENNPNASEDFLLKPKRGRPRKHPKYTLHEGQDARTPWNQNPNRIPPGFEGVNGNQSQQMNPINDANDITVGQAVSGVIDAAFDAGYLLTVRVGDTDTTLRGVVFKPGNFVPVSAENDVAPNLQMIRRNEIPFPHERNGTALPVNGPALSNQVPCARASNTGALKSKHMQSGATQYVSPLLSRGTVVPVVLKPAAGFSNGKVASQQLSQPPHLAACKGKQVSGDANTAKENPVNPMPMVGNQIFPTQPQSNNYNVPKGMQSETVPYGQLPTEGLHDKDPKSMTDMPFEKLLTEVMKRVQVPAQSPGSQMVIHRSNISDIKWKMISHSLLNRYKPYSLLILLYSNLWKISELAR
ncbi:Detected protein of unknown function [Hibiscus syriacus]|uniref:AT hook motif-containing protein n=2 Tax=Hibiscus syriacus TaxID=106335 RepID=A0A6A2ZPY5_HIBSY|nr:Detected protein of unknown function [Hibiscus syriacus]